MTSFLGGAGADVLIFRTFGGNDSLGGFSMLDGDRLELDVSLWSDTHGVLTANEVVSTFGTQSGFHFVLDFGGCDSLTFLWTASLVGLHTNIDIF